MACARGLCTAESIFVFINIAFAMYSGALLATAARLAWDPSTYAWLRFLCETQYRVSTGYVLAAGLALAALVGAAASGRLRLYCGGVLCLAASELGYGVWLAASLAAWWRSSPRAVLARRALDVLHDLKPALLAVERYRDVARPVYGMIEEVEREAPNNAVVVVVFAALGIVLQVAAFAIAQRLLRRGGRPALPPPLAPPADKRASLCRPPAAAADAADDDDDDAESAVATPPGWRRKANLRMYTILDKIF